MSEQLKSCPFCGSKAAVCVEPFSTTQWVECDDCGAEGQTCDSREDAVAAWNSRTPSAERSQEWMIRVAEIEARALALHTALKDYPLPIRRQAATIANLVHVLGPAETGPHPCPSCTVPQQYMERQWVCETCGYREAQAVQTGETGEPLFTLDDVRRVKDAAKRYSDSVANRYPNDDGVWLEDLARRIDGVVHSQSAGQDTP